MQFTSSLSDAVTILLKIFCFKHFFKTLLNSKLILPFADKAPPQNSWERHSDQKSCMLHDIVTSLYDVSNP